MRVQNRGLATLGAFLALIGLFFTVTAPGGLGEVTMVAGVAFLVASMAPVGVVRRFATRRILYVSLALLAVGALLIVAGWSDAAPAWLIIVAGAAFLAGLVLLVLYASAPKAPAGQGAVDGAGPAPADSLSDGPRPR